MSFISIPIAKKWKISFVHSVISSGDMSTIDSEGFKGGTRGSPIMPRDAVSRTANVERTGRHKWVIFKLDKTICVYIYIYTGTDNSRSFFAFFIQLSMRYNSTKFI